MRQQCAETCRSSVLTSAADVPRDLRQMCSEVCGRCQRRPAADVSTDLLQMSEHRCGRPGRAIRGVRLFDYGAVVLFFFCRVVFLYAGEGHRAADSLYHLAGKE